MPTDSAFWDKLKDHRFLLPFVGAFLLTLSLLFIDKLPLNIAQNLFAYTLGAAFIGYFEKMYYWYNQSIERDEKDKKKHNPLVFWVAIGLHLLWIVFIVCRILFF